MYQQEVVVILRLTPVFFGRFPSTSGFRGHIWRPTFIRLGLLSPNCMKGAETRECEVAEFDAYVYMYIVFPKLVDTHHLLTGFKLNEWVKQAQM